MSEEKSNVLTNHIESKKVIELIVIAVITAIVWNLPQSCFGIDGLTVIQQRVIAVFVFATLSWLTEAIPSWATSLGIITLMCLTISDNSISIFKGEESSTFGKLLSSKDIMATFANPVIMLFLGGFILAIAATKSGLDVLLAKNLIKPFGKRSESVLLGFLLITGIFSMFVSNTATAAMMLTFLTPVFAALPANGKGRIALTLSIPIAANIGGMATPIGTPPNAIALQALNNPEGLNLGISFGQWMAFMFPLAITLLVISWVVLKKLFPFSKKTIELEITGNVHHGWRMWVVAGTFIVTILMWLLDIFTGVDANNVALIPIGVFAITGVINGKDLQSIDWSVIWMVAGGFALGLGMNGSGLADAAISSIPFGQWLLFPVEFHFKYSYGCSACANSGRSMYRNGRQAQCHRRHLYYYYRHCFGCIQRDVSADLHAAECHSLLHRLGKAERYAENRTFSRYHQHGIRIHPTLLCRENALLGLIFT